MWHLLHVEGDRAYYVATFASVDAALNYISKEFL
jgi:hypothetical protein